MKNISERFIFFKECHMDKEGAMRIINTFKGNEKVELMCGYYHYSVSYGDFYKDYNYPKGDIVKGIIKRVNNIINKIDNR
jgi:hypothetical protein